MNKKNRLTITFCLLFSFTSYGQSSLSLSAPVIWSKVKVKDNWTPPTAPNYKEYIEGSASGYGINLNYSFHPGFIIKDKHFSVNVGGGYFKQRFDIRRPFNYDTQLQPIYYTDNYSYHSWQWTGGLTYSYPLNKYALTANVSYSELRSFRQEYTPDSGLPSSYGFFTQVNRNQIDFGKILSLGIGVSRYFGKRFLIGVNMIAPVYTRWRNDPIFGDDPDTFSNPKFSLGASLHVSYNFKTKQSL